MNLTTFIDGVRKGPVAFTQTMDVIASNYEYSPTGFYNGEGEFRFYNESGSNEGSCKLFAFARLNGLNKQETLNCFGDYYTVDVLQHPEAKDHQNIRTFIESGWQGISFDSEPLTLKSTLKSNG